ALMQCSKYLDYHKCWEIHTNQNTAMAAKKICDDGKINKAAIANVGTADLYNLKVLAKGFQNNVFNSTKFIVVTGKKIYEKGADKISICFGLPHSSGSLYRALSHFIYNGLNMTKIESRPLETSNWEYRFFVDFEGNLCDAAVKNALRGLKEETTDLMILGNYIGYTEKTI
ncbi:MAG: bifunctional chorismate mutase/prephenate dehydratase, partial [Lachnospiraceae bacterium]|nr:bifunctional chorismate mutase/prephenate dehydratase [Lachnospiraceae bacterium]